MADQPVADQPVADQLVAEQELKKLDGKHYIFNEEGGPEEGRTLYFTILFRRGCNFGGYRRLYSKKSGIPVENLSLYHDRRLIRDEDTVETITIVGEFNLIQVVSKLEKVSSPNSPTIDIIVLTYDEQKLYKLSLDTPMKAFREERSAFEGLQPDGTFLILVHGLTLIRNIDTPRSLGMKDGDVITTWVAYKKTPKKEEVNSVEIKFEAEDGRQLKISGNATDALIVFKQQFADFLGVTLDALLFFYCGIMVDDDETPKILNMRQSETVEVLYKLYSTTE